MISPAQSRNSYRFLTAVTVFAASAVLSACGGSDGGGEGDEDGPRRISESALDVGVYDTEGAEVPKVSTTLANGRAIEAANLAEVLVDPKELDERFETARTPSGAVASPNQLAKQFVGLDADLFAKRISGAGSRRAFAADDPLAETLDLSVTLVSFTEPRFATAMANALAAYHAKDGNDPIFGVPIASKAITLPGVRDVKVHEILVGEDDREPSIAAVSADGRMVISVFASAPSAQTALARELVAKAVTTQRERLDGYEPAAFEELLKLEVPGREIAMLTMPFPGDPKDQETDIPYVWGPKGALHVQSWAGDLGEAFEQADLKHLVTGSTNLYEAGSAKQAEELFEALNRVATEVEYTEKFEPKGLPDARCFELAIESGTRAAHVCRAHIGPYVTEVAGTSADDAEDKVSAQYLILQDEVLGPADDEE